MFAMDIWGEIASQLGAEEVIKPYWVNGPKAVDQRKWKEIIGDKPTLILLDELPPYLDNASTQVFGQGTLANMAVYSLSSLMSAALELPNCAIVIAICPVATAPKPRRCARRFPTFSRKHAGRQ